MYRSTVSTRLARLGLALPIVAGAVVLGAPAPPASAATFTVDDVSDSAATPHTLRWALAEASADPTAPVIELAPGLDIELTCAGGGALAYANAANQPLTIIGNGSTITQTCGASAVLTSADEDVTVRGLTVRGGTAGGLVGGGDVVVEDSTVEGNVGGAGVVAYTGTATIVRSTLRDNIGSAGGGVGAIHVIVDSSTIVGNTATTGAGAWADQSSTAVSSTISGNTASVSGGGLYAGLNDIDLAYVTMVANSAPAGANLDLDSASTLSSFASIIGGDLGGGTGCTLAAGASVASSGANIAGDASCGLEAASGDLVGADPQLAPLADNGGPTPTMLPSTTSPAVDVADCTVAAIGVDQRGVARPQGAACDAGAVEVAAVVEPGGGESTGDDEPVEPEPVDPTVPAGPATAVRVSPRFTG